MISTLNGGGKESHNCCFFVLFLKTWCKVLYTSFGCTCIYKRKKKTDWKPFHELHALSLYNEWESADEVRWFPLIKQEKKKTSCHSWSVAASERPVPKAPGCGSNRQWKASAWGSNIPRQMYLFTFIDWSMDIIFRWQETSTSPQGRAFSRITFTVRGNCMLQLLLMEM